MKDQVQLFDWTSRRARILQSGCQVLSPHQEKPLQAIMGSWWWSLGFARAGRKDGLRDGNKNKDRDERVPPSDNRKVQRAAGRRRGKFGELNSRESRRKNNKAVPPSVQTSLCSQWQLLLQSTLHYLHQQVFLLKGGEFSKISNSGFRKKKKRKKERHVLMPAWSHHIITLQIWYSGLKNLKGEENLY